MDVEKIRNKIITISGEPVTGKGTNVKAIVEKLKQRGYKEENIHVITAGHEFRDYFNTIIEFIANIDETKKSEELAEKTEIKTIMENKEYREKFTKAISKLKANNKIFHSTISIEQANNIPELAEVRAIVDTIIDENIRKKGIEINKEQRPDEVWIIDSRLAFKNIPDSFKVRLTCRPDVAGKRLLGDTSRGKEDNKYKDLNDAIEQREKRRTGEIKRYKERYSVDLTDENNYDLIIDTSFSTVDDISDTILMGLDLYSENIKINKTWTSPKTLLPLQREMDTMRCSCSGNSIDDMINSIRENGYDHKWPIEVIEVDDKKYIIEGHHRNFAAGFLCKTLVPYDVLAKDDEVIPGYSSGRTARQRAEFCKKSDLWGHEQFFERDGSKFSYSNIYPDIYENLKDR